MAYRIAAIPMTLSDIQGKAPTESLFKFFSTSVPHSDKIFTDRVRRAVPLR